MQIISQLFPNWGEPLCDFAIPSSFGHPSLQISSIDDINLTDFPADRNKRIWKNDRGINPGYRTAQQLTQLLAEPNRVASGLRHKALRRSLVPNQQPPPLAR